MQYPLGIQDFETLRTSGYVYVDKTALIYEMTRPIARSYFLSRPRRFGKSLLISTLEAYFLGKKELFQGLAMERLEQQWEIHPVFHLDLNAKNYTEAGSLDEELDKHLQIWEAAYGISADKTLSPETRFYNVIRQAHEQTGKRVVVLVDEYDKPLLGSVDNTELNDAYRKTLKAVFGVLKTLNAYLRFALLTGVSRFSHVSVFSDLNNLDDISMDAAYDDICGISETELHAYFKESILELAAANGLTFEETCERLRQQYDGYHFHPNSVGIYNPFSLLSTFAKQEFNDYWFKTGTPTFLVRMLQEHDYELRDLRGVMADGESLTNVDEEYSDPIPLLFQTGYLTIKGYDARMGYRLDFPNQEVERGFLRFLLPYYTPQQRLGQKGNLNKMTQAVEEGRPEDLMRTLQTMFSGKPYMLEGGDKEVHFQNSLYLVFSMLGYNVQVEQATSRGRIDITIQTPDFVYLMELKLDKTAEEALRQIKDRQYAQPFLADKRKLFLIGASFSSTSRSVEEWEIEEG